MLTVFCLNFKRNCYILLKIYSLYTIDIETFKKYVDKMYIQKLGMYIHCEP